ncbi:hypothetical protein L1887_51971 [Cichorium endivia]|nr:hypothetical protein L1887_51971 [Cichorium endivia]
MEQGGWPSSYVMDSQTRVCAGRKRRMKPGGHFGCTAESAGPRLNLQFRAFAQRISPDAVFVDASQLFASLGQAAPAAGSVVGGQAGLALPCARRHVSRRINESAERRASIRGAISCAGCCGSHRAQNPGWNSARQCTCALLGGENGCVRNSRSPARARPFLDAVGWTPTSNRRRLECSKRSISKK